MELNIVPEHPSTIDDDDFASRLEAELESCDDDKDLERRVKRQKLDLHPGTVNPQSSSTQGESSGILGLFPREELCPHPVIFAQLCSKCGELVDDDSAVPLTYIHKDLSITDVEKVRICDDDFKNLLCNRRKLYLVLDLDHTLLNSAWLADIKEEEIYLDNHRDALPDSLKASLFRLDKIPMMTKLRPFVRTFLEEASSLFEMYIYTMGERPYAREMARLLDPTDKYFGSRTIAKDDCTKENQKSLDIVLGQESTVLILDDREAVWREHKDNLILMEKYIFFASSCKGFRLDHKSFYQQRSHESETEGALAEVLKMLQRVHSLCFDEGCKDNLEDRDVRQVLKTVVKEVRKEVLKNCRIVFTCVFPTNDSTPERHPLWRMVEQLGATCSMEVDPSVTHVVSSHAGTNKSRWAVKHNKFLVSTKWLEACNDLRRKQPEQNFPVTSVKPGSLIQTSVNS